MSQDQAPYTAGNQPAAIIDPPRNVKAISESGTVNYQVWGWVKLSAKFIYHIKRLKGARLAIMMTLALSVDEAGKCKRTIKQLCELTDYSHTEVISSLKELDEMGYITVQRDARGNIYDPEFVARGEQSPSDDVVKKLESTGLDSTPVYRVESSPAEENAVPSIKRVKRVNTPNINGIQAAMMQNRPVTEADLTDKAERLALTAFETALGLPGNWQWYPSKSSIEAEWRALRKFLTAEFAKDAGAFGRYAEWRKGAGQYKGAMSNKAIAFNPALFQASWSDFLAHTAMYQPVEKTRLL